MSAAGTDATPRRTRAVQVPVGPPGAKRWGDRLADAPGPVLLVVVGLAYLALSQLVMLRDDPVTGTSLWPAVGLTLGVLMLVPTHRWGWVVGAVALAELASDLAWGYPVGATLGWALSNIAGPLLAAFLLRRAGNVRGALAPVRPLLQFLVLGVVVGPLAGATIGAVTTALSSSSGLAEVWADYFVGDALGVLVVAPLLLASRGPDTRRSWRELVALILSTAVVSIAVFTDFGGSWMITMPYLLIPYFAWAALRFGTLGTAWTSLGVTAVASVFTAGGVGPFALAGEPEGIAVTLLQIFLAATVSFALLLAALVSDLSDRRQIEAALRHQATHDPLTGLPNRSRFAEELEDALAAADETGRRIGLLFCDLDGLKAVNDRLGHKGGDELLIEVARRLRGCVRPDDLVARISGDEFVVLLLEVDEDVVQRVARRLVDEVAEPFRSAPQREIRPSISVGAAVAEAGDTPDSLFRVTDTALYRAKRRGRGRVVVVDEALRREAGTQVRDEGQLPAAFEEDQLVCHFQPVVELASGRLVGAEASVRWQHPDLGLLDADRFIPAVEALGWGDRLFETVLTQSLQAQMQWPARTGQRPRVSVNISALQLGSGGVVNAVLRALADTDAPAEALCVEVTNTTPLDDVGVASLNQLHALGVHLVLDGFGAGWASMSRIARIKWDLLKVDRSFVAGLGTDPSAIDMVRAMVAMADALGIRAGADGVTRIGQLEVLADLGCEVAQGPLFSRHEPAEEVGRMLASERVWTGEELVRKGVTEELAAAVEV
jgi:diguanylate cyclase (GGDEF)-like protein